MNAITPLARAVLDVLDTCERGAGDTEIGVAILWREPAEIYSDFDELLETLVQMIDVGLIEARFADWPRDTSVSVDPILYELTEAGCDALWALQKAERVFADEFNAMALTPPRLDWRPVNLVTDEPIFARPVSFNSREAFINFCQGGRA